jgi:hypothetical protein
MSLMRSSTMQEMNIRESSNGGIKGTKSAKRAHLEISLESLRIPRRSVDRIRRWWGLKERPKRRKNR